MKFHSVAGLFPPMTTRQFKELVSDIKEHGQIEPILTCSGKIADGRHRFRACRQLKIEPKFVRWEDIRPTKESSLVQYIISKNLRRRHLDAGQRAAIATDALPLIEEEAKARKKIAGSKAGKLSGKIRRAKKEAKQEAETPDSELKVPEIFPEPSHTKYHEIINDSESAPPKKAKNRDQESSAKVARQMGVSDRYVREAKAIGAKSDELLNLVKTKAVSIPLAKKISQLEPEQLQYVLHEGQNIGYKKALESLYGEKDPTDHDIALKLKQAIKQATALNKTLTAVLKMTKYVKVEKGPGSISLLSLLEEAKLTVSRITDETSAD